MTLPQSHADLLEQPGIASLSTLGSDGYPQVTALWYLREGDVIRTSLLTSRQKYKNTVAHPKATLMIIDPQNPYRTVEIRGDVEYTDDPDLEMFERIVRHYGQDPETFPAPKEGRVVMTLIPNHLVANG